MFFAKTLQISEESPQKVRKFRAKMRSAQLRKREIDRAKIASTRKSDYNAKIFRKLFIHFDKFSIVVQMHKVRVAVCNVEYIYSWYISCIHPIYLSYTSCIPLVYLVYYRNTAPFKSQWRLSILSTAYSVHLWEHSQANEEHILC